MHPAQTVSDDGVHACSTVSPSEVEQRLHVRHTVWASAAQGVNRNVLAMALHVTHASQTRSLVVVAAVSSYDAPPSLASTGTAT